jgi:UDP-N-acetylmuramoylalanine--D-glutamate ligase
MTNALVLGLAETGLAVARRLRSEGAAVTVIEDFPAATAKYRERVAALEPMGVTLVEAPDPDRVGELVRAAALVVPSPLVRPSHVAVVAARAAGIPIRSEIDLAGERVRVPIVAVTGTNGKTTVTSMIDAMLAASGRRSLAAGNIGRPLLDVVDEDVDVIVAEVSSFQLAFSDTFRPRVAVMLAITPDHLDWHGTLDQYVAAKARLASNQRAGDLLVYDADDESAREIASSSRARIVGVSAHADADGCFRVGATELLFPDGRELAPIASMRRALLHDRTNALTAAAAALDVGANLDGVRDCLANYATMRHRVELVGEAMGVRWYDDSKATNPDATLRAVASFDSVVLLAGGRNKGLDLSPIGAAADHLRGVVAFGEAGAEIVDAIAGRTPVVRVAGMHDAVVAARELAEPGDVVLLSPACASFDAYDGYAARGDAFADEVRALLADEASPR